MRKMLALTALTILTACDYAGKRDLREEHDSRLYREAMEDYRAGRLNVAIEGLEKCVRQDPANASARFQLACLMQDAKSDFESAYCGYREYLLQHPESDKATLAKTRLADCERAMAGRLAAKYGLNVAAEAERQARELREQLKEAEQRIAQMEQNLAASQSRVRSLSDERERLVKIVKGGDAVVAEQSVSPVLREAKDLLEEGDEEMQAVSRSDEAAQLREEEEAEKVGTALFTQSTATADEQAARARRTAEERKRAEDRAKAEAKLAQLPDTYQVQEGDTLYGIAKRFYGSISAWKKIRDANKAVISSDSRVRVGDVIKLPKIEL